MTTQTINGYPIEEIRRDGDALFAVVGIQTPNADQAVRRRGFRVSTDGGRTWSAMRKRDWYRAANDAETLWSLGYAGQENPFPADILPGRDAR